MSLERAPMLWRNTNTGETGYCHQFRRVVSSATKRRHELDYQVKGAAMRLWS